MGGYGVSMSIGLPVQIYVGKTRRYYTTSLPGADTDTAASLRVERGGLQVRLDWQLRSVCASSLWTSQLTGGYANRSVGEASYVG
jgi:hypothetical protein